MNRLLTLSSLAFLVLTSCSKYAVNTISNSTDRIKKNTDSVEVVYKVNNEDAMISLDLKNNSSEHMYIDWTKSTMMVNGQAIPLVAETKVVNSTIEMSPVVRNLGTISGTVDKPNDFTQLPPHSFITKSLISLNNYYNSFLKDSLYTTKRLYTSNGSLKIKEANFTEANSPLVLRIQLFSYKGKSNKEVLLADSFFLAKSVRTNYNPNIIAEIQNKDNRVFYVKKSTASKKIAGGLGVAAIAGVGLMLAEKEAPNPATE